MLEMQIRCFLINMPLSSNILVSLNIYDDLHYLSYFEVIPTLSIYTSLPNYPETELVRTAFNLRLRTKKIIVMCSRSPQNLEFVYFTLLFCRGR